MNVPEHYLNVISRLTTREISYGYGGVELAEIAELQDRQTGYSVAPDGKSLCSQDHSAWRANWIVIGSDTLSGDPILLDRSNPKLPVLTAIHGEGAWEPELIATSIDAFVQSLNELARIAIGRANPVELENNPLPEAERKTFIERIRNINQDEAQSIFWGNLIEEE